MRKSVKDALYFTPRERKGIFVLLFLIISLAFAPSIIEAFHNPEPVIDTTKLELAYADLKQQHRADSIHKIKSYRSKYSQTSYSPKRYAKKRVEAESNSVWIEPEQQKAQEVEQVALFVNEAKPEYREVEEEIKAPIVVDVNTATPEAWQQLSGIGPSFSNRIVKFRNGLGGFHNIQQVGETFGLPPETFAAIKSQLVISGGVSTINVGTASEDALKAHPYISPGFAKQIINYRTKVEPITSDEIFLKLYFMDEEKLKQLKPYIEY